MRAPGVVPGRDTPHDFVLDARRRRAVRAGGRIGKTAQRPIQRRGAGDVSLNVRPGRHRHFFTLATQITAHAFLEKPLLARHHRHISLVAYFYAMSELPLATVITLNYTSPIWLTWLSVLLLKERFNPRLLFAIALGFVGVAMLLRPAFASDQAVPGIIGLASGFFAACAYVNVKKLGAAGEPAWRVVFYFSVIGTFGSALVQPLAGPFHPINAANFWPLLGMGLLATLAQLAMTRAYHSGNTLVVGAFAYSTVIFAAIIGLLFFGEQLPLLAWIGMLVIIASGLLAKLASERPDNNRPDLPAEED